RRRTAQPLDLLTRGTGELSGGLRSGLNRPRRNPRLRRNLPDRCLDGNPSRSTTVESSEGLTRTGRRARSAAKLLRNGRGTVGDSAPVSRVMPPRPLAAASRGHATHVPVPVY